MNLLARARGLQEGIRPIRLVSSQEVGNVCTTETLVIDEPAREVLLVRNEKDRTGQQATS